jgi:excinuclease UvrABC nuclease subunit
MVASIFDGLPSLGPVRRKALLSRFVSLEELAKANDEDILAVAPLAPEVLSKLKERVQKLLNKTPNQPLAT